jgi:hypothetical protein
MEQVDAEFDPELLDEIEHFNLQMEVSLMLTAQLQAAKMEGFSEQYFRNTETGRQRSIGRLRFKRILIRLITSLK